MMLKLIVCPKCKQQMELLNDKLVCNQCKCTYGFMDNIPVMLDDMGNPGASNGHKNAVKENIIRTYREVDRQLTESGTGRFATFLNLGYVPDENKQYSKISLDGVVVNRNSIKLLLELVGDMDIQGKKVVEVGCGRGGNIATIHRYFQPEIIIGMDLCPDNIRFCKKKHRFSNVDFCIGDAESLPFAEGEFDAALSIESSHSYPDRHRFFREVYRILGKGGYFLYTDILDSSVFSEEEEYLLQLGFDVVRNQDITANVLLSCDLVAEERVEIYGNISDSSNQQKLEEFLYKPGTREYEELRKGEKQYRILNLIKK